VSDYFSENVRAIELDMPLFAARKSDPPTSHAAAKINRKGKKWRVLEALRLGPAGQTEIAARCGLVPHEVNKRLNDLRHARLAKCTGKEVRNAGGLLENEWRATDVG
jgi:transcription initiation factor IIE alpha subunit